MKIYFIGLILISLFFLTACENIDLSKVSDEDLGRLAEKAVVCNKPYIRFGTSCCLDTNDNKICDRDERELTKGEKEQEEQVTTKEEEAGREEPKEEVVEKTEYTLADYPSFFIKGNSFNGVLVIGDKAPAEDVIGISDIAVSLQQANIPQTGINIEIGATKLVSEVPDLYDSNAILVGTPCVNKFVAELMKSDLTKCSGNNYLDFEKGKGIIKLYEVSGKVYVVATGYSPADVRKATKVLANYGDYSFSDTEWFTS